MVGRLCVLEALCSGRLCVGCTGTDILLWFEDSDTEYVLRTPEGVTG